MIKYGNHLIDTTEYHDMEALSSSVSRSLRHVILLSTHFKEYMLWKTRTRKEKWWMVSSLIHDLSYRQSLKDGSLYLFVRSLNSIPPFQSFHLILAHIHDLQFHRLALLPNSVFPSQLPRVYHTSPSFFTSSQVTLSTY